MTDQNCREGRSILIVEDEALIRFDLADFFADAGFLVHDAANADEAIALMEVHCGIRVVLTDVQMPGSMDGVRLAHFVRDRYPPTVLVVASGAVRPTPEELPCRAIFIPKPFDPRAVLGIIDRAA